MTCAAAISPENKEEIIIFSLQYDFFLFLFFYIKSIFFFLQNEKKLFSTSLILLKVATILACKSWIGSDCILIPTKFEFPSMQVYPTPLTQRTQIPPFLTVMEEIKKILSPANLCKNTNP